MKKRRISPKQTRANQGISSGSKPGSEARKSVKRHPSAKLSKGQPTSGDARFPIVGIGASAGGLEAFSELLKHLPVDTGMGFVLVQHLDPEHESALAHLLARSTKMPVSEVTNNLRIEPDHVYVIPPNVQMAINRGLLKLSPRRKETGATLSIDFFFESLAADRNERAIGVVLSGAATDGTIGLEAIKAEGGMTFAQDASAKYDSMPKSAIAAGCVDFVLAPKAISAELAEMAKHPYVAGHPRPPAPEKTKSSTEREANLRHGLGIPHDTAVFEKTLLLLRTHCGVDFSLYKTSTIRRRVNRRLALNKFTTLEQYASFLKGNAKELDALYSDALINVTSFFRNPQAFDLLKRKVFPKLLAQRGSDENVRIWVLGCSTGQEAYSLAMAFAEVAAKDPRAIRLQVFATDLSEAVLEKARSGFYANALLQGISPERLRRFFVEERGGYRVSKALREQVVFARHNVISDPPFSRMDLVTCRNLLIYLEPELQKKIIPAFHYAIKPGGYLFLGASESIGQFPELFLALDKRQKIFARKVAPTPAFRLTPGNERARHRKRELQHSVAGAVGKEMPEALRGEYHAQREADRITLNAFGPPGVLVDSTGHILQFRGSTGTFLEAPSGKISSDVLKMARDGLMLPLRAALNEAKRKNRTVRREGTRLREDQTPCQVDIQVIPLRNLKEKCFLIFFADVGSGKRTRLLPPPPPALQPSSRREVANRISELERELNETRDYMQALQEKNEAASEELQATQEEAQSSNEELQSLNEELETSKEELESTNEELTTINDEMVSRNTELTRLYSDLSNFQSNLQTAIVLLGRDLTIRRFTAPAEKLFNLVAADLGRGFGGVRHTFDLPHFERLLTEVVETVRGYERDLQDSSGHWYAMRARPYLTIDNVVDGVVLILTDIDALKRSEQEVKRARDDAIATVQSMPMPYLILSSDLRVNSASDVFYRDFQVSPGETEGHLIYDLGSGQWRIPALRSLLEELLPQKKVLTGYEVTHDFPALGTRTMWLNARRLDSTDGKAERILLSIEDITSRKRAQDALHESNQRTLNIFESITDACYTLDKEWRFTYLNSKAEEIFRPIGKTAENLLGRTIWQEFPDTIGTVVEDAFRRTITTETKAEFELFYPPLKMWLEARVYPSKDGLSVYFQDISARKKAEEALVQAKERADASLRAKDDFLAALSHELRTPLTPVFMAAGALKDDARLPSDVREQLGMMERNIALEARLIDDLLDITAIVRGKLQLQLQLCDAHALIGLALEIVRNEARAKDITITLTLDAKDSRIIADPARFQQVMWNLLRNSVKFTPTGGRISVTTHQETKSDNSAWLRIEVVDSGLGIDSAMLNKIFLPFDQGSLVGPHRFGGLGLGLSIAHAVVQLHEGQISARSEGKNRGATFTVSLPGAKAPHSGTTISAAPFTTPAAAKKASPLRLLVIEDHESTLQALSRMLKLDGHSIVGAKDLAGALAAASTHQFDLVISDLGLPDGTGTELMEKLRDLYGLKGIALSGYGMEEDLARSRASGFIAHLVKPTSVVELRRVLAEMFPKTTQS